MMPSHLSHLLASLTLLFGLTMQVLASDASSPTEALEFARQCGRIAGAVRACGGDIARFNTRVGEAIEALALTPTDKRLATLLFEQVARNTLSAEQKNHTVSCDQTLQIYQNLPILQDDYKQTVLNQQKPDRLVTPSNLPLRVLRPSAPSTAKQDPDQSAK